MEPADSISRLGFARWYERRLIEGHAWFISCFLCMVAIAACMEELNLRGPLRRLRRLREVQDDLGIAGALPQMPQRVAANRLARRQAR